MRFLLSVTFIALALAGCQLGPPQPELTTGAISRHFAGTGAAQPLADPHARWWEAFGDADLSRLIAEGVDGNLDVIQARDRIAAADAQADVANAGTMPTLTVGLANTTNHNVGKATYFFPSYQTSGGSVKASWTPDFFGQVRSQTESAVALAGAERAARDAARLAVISNVAQAYVDARYFAERARIAAADLAARRQTLELTERLNGQGVSSTLDVQRVRQTIDRIGSELPAFETERAKAIHRIATLTGRAASEPPPEARAGGPQPIPRDEPQAGVPADLLRNRPDIARAEREFAAAIGDIGFAWSQFFPTVTLSGSVTPAWVSMKPRSGMLTTWSFGPTLTLPIFDGGAIAGNYRAAIARAYQKRDAWRAAVLGAVEEVENALSAYRHERAALAALERSVSEAERAVRLSRLSYRQGMLSLIDALDSERALYDAESALAQSRRNLAADYIVLNIAVARGVPGPGRAEVAARRP